MGLRDVVGCRETSEAAASLRTLTLKIARRSPIGSAIRKGHCINCEDRLVVHLNSQPRRVLHEFTESRRNSKTQTRTTAWRWLEALRQSWFINLRLARPQRPDTFKRVRRRRRTRSAESYECTDTQERYPLSDWECRDGRTLVHRNIGRHGMQLNLLCLWRRLLRPPLFPTTEGLQAKSYVSWEDLRLVTITSFVRD